MGLVHVHQDHSRRSTFDYSFQFVYNTSISLLSRNAGVIYKLKPMFPTYVLQMLYSTLMLPYLNYGILAWGSSLKLQLDKILVVQKRAIRTICNVPIRTHSSPLFFNTKVLRVWDIFNLQLGCLMFQLNNNELPQALSYLFKKRNQVHEYSTRQAFSYHLPRTRTSFAQNTLIYTGPKFWNSLDSVIKRSVSVHVFRRKLKSYYLNTYCHSWFLTILVSKLYTYVHYNE